MLDFLRKFKKDNGIPIFAEYKDKNDKNWDLIPLGITKDNKAIFWEYLLALIPIIYIKYLGEIFMDFLMGDSSHGG